MNPRELNITVSGSGPNLILLHGWGSHAEIWNRLVKDIEPHFRVHRIDLPGHGKSSLEMPDALDHRIECFTSQLPTPAIVCGWSLGAQIALYWVTHYPAQVRRLILVAATPCFVRRDDWPHAMPSLVIDNFERGLSEDSTHALKRFVALQAHGDVAAAAVGRELRKSLNAVPPQPAALVAALKLLRATDQRPYLATIAVPTLVVHGDRDVITPLAAGTWLAQTLPAAQLSVFSGAAHAPFLSQAKTFVKQLVEFCDER